MTEPEDEPKLDRDRLAAALGAQRDGGAPRPKRFFKVAQVTETGDGFVLTLDHRPARTPAKRPLALPTRAAAEALAAEWNDLGEVIDPAVMPLTRITNAAIDGVAGQPQAVLDEVAKYLGSDLLFYRAGEAALAAEQARDWDPMIDWCRETYGVRFVLAEGIVHVAQPPRSLARMREALSDAVGEGSAAPFRLAALNVMTTLTGSAILALAVLCGRLSAEDGWADAHVDERFQERAWGQDAEALERREKRWAEMSAAERLGRLCQNGLSASAARQK